MDSYLLHLIPLILLSVLFGSSPIVHDSCGSQIIVSSRLNPAETTHSSCVVICLVLEGSRRSNLNCGLGGLDMDLRIGLLILNSFGKLYRTIPKNQSCFELDPIIPSLKTSASSYLVDRPWSVKV
jgi:hypothetical protein